MAGCRLPWSMGGLSGAISGGIGSLDRRSRAGTATQRNREPHPQEAPGTAAREGGEPPDTQRNREPHPQEAPGTATREGGEVRLSRAGGPGLAYCFLSGRQISAGSRAVPGEGPSLSGREAP
jgi:hypothetical protein